MTRARKARKKAARRTPPPAAPAGAPRALVAVAALGAAAIVVAGIAVWRASDGGEQTFTGVPAVDPGPVHVHGLGINPADDSLFIATHTGLFRVAEGERQARRVGDRFQDTMGFTIVGANRFLGSGHPDADEAREEGLPPHLGLIESTDAGETWEPISLLGEADFHVLRFAGRRLYGYDASNDRLLVSADRGRAWKELEKPGPIVDLAVAPTAPGQLLVTTAGGLVEGLFESRDGGEAWRKIGDAVGLLAWPERDRLYLVAGNGRVFRSPDGGRRFEYRSEIGGEPAALLATGADDVYVALHDGTIKRSSDGGQTWAVRSAP